MWVKIVRSSSLLNSLCPVLCIVCALIVSIYIYPYNPNNAQMFLSHHGFLSSKHVQVFSRNQKMSV